MGRVRADQCGAAARWGAGRSEPRRRRLGGQGGGSRPKWPGPPEIEAVASRLTRDLRFHSPGRYDRSCSTLLCHGGCKASNRIRRERS